MKRSDQIKLYQLLNRGVVYRAIKIFALVYFIGSLFGIWTLTYGMFSAAVVVYGMYVLLLNLMAYKMEYVEVVGGSILFKIWVKEVIKGERAKRRALRNIGVYILVILSIIFLYIRFLSRYVV